jgi:hypothetical protein
MSALRRSGAALVAVGLIGAAAGVAGATAAAAKGGQARPPKPEQSIESVISGFEKALASGDCEELGRYTLHSTLRTNSADPAASVKPDTPPTSQECDGVEEVRGVLKGFKAKRSKQFGTAAIVEGTGTHVPDLSDVTFWTVDVDGKWRVIFSGWGWEHQLGAKPDRELDFDATAKDFVDGFRAKDCRAIWKAWNVSSPSVTNRPGVDDWCQDFADGLALGAGKAYDLSRVKANPKRLGGTHDVVFYGLPFQNGRYLTLMVGAQRLGGTVDLTSDDEAEHSDPGIVQYVTNRLPRAQ